MRTNSNKYVHLCLHILPLFYLSFLFHNLTILIDAKTPPLYVPVDHITHNCGSLVDLTSTVHNRTWTADTNSKFLLVDPNNISVASSAAHVSFTIDPVPYATARISRSQFTYVYSLASSGPKFVRLYFYPAFYPGFNGYDAYFSVNSGRYTFLSNFSPALYAQNFGLEAFYKEFCLNVEEGQTLNITFTPTPGILNTQAFINGIEIVSMPADLYYTTEANPGLKSVGMSSVQQKITNNTALELMYRVNVGGASIPPNEDTGMYRNWDNDEKYLTVAETSVQPRAGIGFQLNFSRIQNYSAPALVYLTGRSMGINKTINDKYYLTWEFQVDSTFTYFVRLHFCEFQPPIQNMGDRNFRVLLDSLTAEAFADIIYWSGGNGIPIYRDYAVTIGQQEKRKVQNLSIALGTNPASLTSYSDAILNGLEIFKLSTNDNPAVPMDPPANAPVKISRRRNKVVTIIAGAVSGFFGLLLVLIFSYFWRSLKAKDSDSRDEASSGAELVVSSHKFTKTNNSSRFSDICFRFSLAEIKVATNNFDDSFVIGIGGFGNVYKGTINDGLKMVAIKRSNPGSQQGENEFKTEIEMLSQLQHIHLVSLIGYCNEDQEMILVYDYMSRETLRDHLYNTKNPPLSWHQRLEICIGAADGLHYLHSGSNHMIIHRDVKTTNILLDDNWVAKVSDFGLSKMRPANISKSHITTVIKGSYGYLDPEYYRRQQLTEKSDVYSFGVVLFEVLCGRPAVDLTQEDDERASLAAWACECYCNGTLNHIIDPSLAGKIAPQCFKIFSEIAVSCLYDERIKRPSMGDVVSRLELALQLQKSAEDEIKRFGAVDIKFEVPFKVSQNIVASLKASTMYDICDNSSIEDGENGFSSIATEDMTGKLDTS